jgi:hypothetical protein
MKNQEEIRKISPKEAQELLKSGKARLSSRGKSIDSQSILFSLFFFVFLAAGTAIYLEFFGDTRLIKDFIPQPFPTQLFSEKLQQEDILSIQNWEREQEFAILDSLISTQLYQTNMTMDQEKFVWQYKNELLLALHDYDAALGFSQTLQSRFSDQKDMLAPILWYRAHAYYYLKRFLDAHQQFATVAIMNHPEYSSKAKEYQDAIYELIRTDGLNAFFE